MPDNAPLVSVIVTTRNNETTLPACLASVQQQSYAHCELLVIDNHSTDKTRQIAKTFTNLVFSKGPERSVQRNFGVAKAAGDYIFIVDSDMELPPTAVEECIGLMNKETRAAIVPELSFGEGFWANCKALERSFYVGVDWIEAPRFFSKALYKKVGGYNETMSGGEDWDLSNRIKAETKIAHTKSFIRHNEGKTTFKTIVGKRRYYTKGFNEMYDNARTNQVPTVSPAKQALSTYGLFVSHPIKLLKRPHVGAGMLIMKTSEFAVMASGRYLRKAKSKSDA